MWKMLHVIINSCTKMAGSSEWFETLYIAAAPKHVAIIIHQQWYNFMQDILNLVAFFGNGQHQIGNTLNFMTKIISFSVTLLRMTEVCYVISVLQVDIVGKGNSFTKSIHIIYWMLQGFATLLRSRNMVEGD